MSFTTGCDRHVSLGKTCMVAGCQKRVRTASFYCINHGGGQRCMVEGCTASARDGFLYCIRHGGGHRCIENDCLRSAVGKTLFCKKHGGGRRCQHPGCHAPARSGGKVQMCQKHGGGKRCSRDGCDRMAIPRSNFCKTHHQIQMALNSNQPEERFEQAFLDGEYYNDARLIGRAPSTPKKMPAVPSRWKPLPMTDSEKKSYDRICNYNRTAGDTVERSTDEFTVVQSETEFQDPMLQDMVILYLP
ncbi:hypothetical protein FOL47_002499 [Perkinsus chesapeaki]|uniref:WRKY19-like zinc finger domain-containing protein n=1 Tax=Perkinsus chesapeaki TaxID=330153 RepID=A0A7J6N1H1_PERCH|nr:hypothetical protein FOL47_002499 [Perkinsus chesapeaki]